MAEPTWDMYELPILEAIRSAEIAGTSLTKAEAESLPDLEERLHAQATKSLIDGGFIQGQVLPEPGSARLDFLIDGLTSRGRIAVGQWPSGDPYESLVRALEAQLNRTTDIAERSRLTRLRDALLGVSGDVIRAAIIAAATGAIPRL